jgi:hypothetical protein
MARGVGKGEGEGAGGRGRVLSWHEQQDKCSEYEWMWVCDAAVEARSPPGANKPLGRTPCPDPTLTPLALCCS